MIKDDGGLYLLYVRLSSVGVARNVVGGVAWTEGPAETPGPPCVWRWLMMPRGIRPTDPSVPVKGWWCGFWNGLPGKSPVPLAPSCGAHVNRYLPVYVFGMLTCTQFFRL